jgi:hypothetical protein
VPLFFNREAHIAWQEGTTSDILRATLKTKDLASMRYLQRLEERCCRALSAHADSQAGALPLCTTKYLKYTWIKSLDFQKKSANLAFKGLHNPLELGPDQDSVVVAPHFAQALR